MIVLIIAVGVFVFSLYQLFINLWPYFEGGRIYDGVRLHITTEQIVDEGGNTRVRLSSIDFEGLREINPDTIAWLRFDQPEAINYPVVRSHDNAEYLTRAFDGSYNILGAIFMDMYNNANFRDRNTFIHGHNMHIGGGMFSQLSDYRDVAFARANPYFYIYTPDGFVRTYRVFAAAEVRDNDPRYQMNFVDDADFQNYLDMIRQSSFYIIEEVQVGVDSHIVTLSTCTNVRDEDRFILHGVLVALQAEWAD